MVFVATIFYMQQVQHDIANMVKEIEQIDVAKRFIAKLILSFNVSCS